MFIEYTCNKSTKEANIIVNNSDQINNLNDIKENIIKSLIFSHGFLNKNSQENLKQRLRNINASNEKE